MGSMKTPGVYVVEKSAFPNSVVEVATAVPAFIGYTEKADNKGKSLKNKPTRISSMAEYHNYFGFGPSPSFSIGDVVPPAEDDFIAADDTDVTKSKAYQLALASNKYYLYYSLMLFFQNGGGPCYIISVGKYEDGAVAKANLAGGIPPLKKEQEPTMVVIPDAVALAAKTDCDALQTAMTGHCKKMQSRFAILDVFDGYKDRDPDPAADVVTAFREGVGINDLDYAAAYYPWVNTSIVQANELTFQNIDDASLAKLQILLRAELSIENPLPADASPKVVQANTYIENLTNGALSDSDKSETHKSLAVISDVYKIIMGELRNKLNLLPPSAAMAGIYTMVDNTRGVWKAPANVSLNAVISPAVNITHEDQEDLNVPTNGKAINAIRSFIGEGTLVWGGRTLDGNSLDWRYVNVRRTMIMLEESIRLASKAYVFEPNNANTWVTMKSMIRNFLTGIWKRGGLAGASPEDAFSVFVGLGETMTSEDILEGILKITVLVAVSRPAEFIEITFQQQMQKS